MNSKILYNRLGKMKKSLMKLPHICGESRMCAVILDSRGIPISTGYNSYKKTHPIMRNFVKKELLFSDGSNGDKKIYLHAELDCYDKGLSQKNKWNTMIITRIDANNNFRLAKPCVGCFEMIKNSFVNVYYTDNNGNLILLKTGD